MLKWAGIVAIALIVLEIFGYLRNVFFPRRRLAKFLRDRNVIFSRIEISGSYGWPGYVIVFDSVERSVAFQQSAVFQTFIDEVGNMHQGIKLGGSKFDASLSVSVATMDLTPTR